MLSLIVATVLGSGLSDYRAVLERYFNASTEYQKQRNLATATTFMKLMQSVGNEAPCHSQDIFEDAMAAHLNDDWGLYFLFKGLKLKPTPRLSSLALRLVKAAIVHGGDQTVDDGALDIVAHSREPSAIQFMTDALRSRTYSPEAKAAAYWHLAGTAGQKGADMVLALRRGRQLLPTFRNRLDLEDPRSEHPFIEGPGPHYFETPRVLTILISEKTVGDVSWRLLESPVLGYGWVLFLTKKGDGIWSTPVFTGVAEDSQPPEVAFGYTGEALVAGAWVNLIPHYAELAKDSDGDGLTDLAERRLGLNPYNSDTNGDGVPDEIDPCPNATGAPKTEEDKIMAVAFEAETHFDLDSFPVFVAVKGETRLYELPGWPGPEIRMAADDMYMGSYQDRWSSQFFLILSKGSIDARTKESYPFREKVSGHLFANVMVSSPGKSGRDADRIRLEKFGRDWVVISLDPVHGA